MAQSPTHLPKSPLPDARGALQSPEAPTERVLLIEPDAALAEQVAHGLREERLEVTRVATGRDGVDLWQRGDFHVVILEHQLPDASGNALCTLLRGESNVGIVVLGSRTHEADRIIALEIGADDFLTAPFGVGELVARVRALIRRSTLPPLRDGEEFYRVGDVSLNVARHSVRVNGKPIRITRKGFDLLRLLLAQAGQVLTREQLLAEVWGAEEDVSNTLEAHIRLLRKQLEANPSQPKRILTVRGRGYLYALEEPPL